MEDDPNLMLEKDENLSKYLQSDTTSELEVTRENKVPTVPPAGDLEEIDEI